MIIIVVCKCYVDMNHMKKSLCVSLSVCACVCVSVSLFLSLSLSVLSLSLSLSYSLARTHTNTHTHTGLKSKEDNHTGCRTLSNQDYIDIVWTTCAEFPGELLSHNNVWLFPLPARYHMDFNSTTDYRKEEVHGSNNISCCRLL